MTYIKRKRQWHLKYFLFFFNNYFKESPVPIPHFTFFHPFIHKNMKYYMNSFKIKETGITALCKFYTLLKNKKCICKKYDNTNSLLEWHVVGFILNVALITRTTITSWHGVEMFMTYIGQNFLFWKYNLGYYK